MGLFENLMKLNGKQRELYADKVNRMVREKYSVADEIAIIRQRDTKSDEFAIYNAFVEECKRQAREE